MSSTKWKWKITWWIMRRKSPYCVEQQTQTSASKQQFDAGPR
jgi:hypothetical protein